METWDAITARRNVRELEDRPLAREHLERASVRNPEEARSKPGETCALGRGGDQPWGAWRRSVGAGGRRGQLWGAPLGEPSRETRYLRGDECQTATSITGGIGDEHSAA